MRSNDRDDTTQKTAWTYTETFNPFPPHHHIDEYNTFPQDYSRD